MRNPPDDNELTTASDGELARVVRSWAEEKLHYVREYTGIFSTGMKDIWDRRAYIDLFAGPGRCWISDSAREIPGSPVIAATTKYPFTDLYFNDKDPRAVTALAARLTSLGVTHAITTAEDCNVAALAARAALFSGRDASKTLGLAFVDPTGFQISLESIEQMTRGLKIDLMITFMTGYLKRFIGTPSLARALDSFFGSTDWRPLATRPGGESLTYRHLLDHYEDKLRAIGYRHVNDHIRILNSNDSAIYHLVFASKHPRGDDFFRKISRKRFGGQWSLDLGD